MILTNLRFDKHPIPMVIYEFSFTLGLALHCEYLMKKKISSNSIQTNEGERELFCSTLHSEQYRFVILDLKYGSVLNNPLLGLHFQKTL